MIHFGMESFTETGTVKLFPQKGGWYYLLLPKIYTAITKEFANRGLVPITATVGESTWKTSLLPMGDGTLFIALNAKVRKNENIIKGDTITITFSLR